MHTIRLVGTQAVRVALVLVLVSARAPSVAGQTSEISTATALGAGALGAYSGAVLGLVGAMGPCNRLLSGALCPREAAALGGASGHAGPHLRQVVVLLQEAHRRSDALPSLRDPGLAGSPSYHHAPRSGDPDVVETAARYRLATAYLPSGRNGANRDGQPRLDKGNAILSTLPLDGVAAVEVPYETERKGGVVGGAAAWA